jgi:hypothetical protein
MKIIEVTSSTAVLEDVCVPSEAWEVEGRDGLL